MHPTIASQLAGAKLPEEVRGTVERVLLRHQQSEALSESAYLSKETWFALYPTKPLPALERAQRLLRRTLSTSQRLHVITVDKRHKALAELLAHNTLTASEQEALRAAKGYTPRLAGLLYPQATPSTRDEVAQRAGGTTLLAHLARPTTPAGLVTSQLAEHAQWGPFHQGRTTREGRELLAWVLSAHPGAAHVAAQSTDSALQLVAAGCRNLLVEDQEHLATLDPESLGEARWMLMALVNNPVTDPGVVRTVLALARSGRDHDLADSCENRLRRRDRRVSGSFQELSGEDLSWILQRTLRSDFRPEGRPWDLPALALNPALASDEVGNRDLLRVCQDLEAWDVRATLGDHHLVLAQAMSALHGHHLPRSWGQDEPAPLQRAPAPRPELSDEEVAAFPASRLGAGWVDPDDPAWTWVAQRLGCDEPAWESFVVLSATATGSLAELVELSTLVVG